MSIETANETGFNVALSGVCKDCGNGTLNNDINEAFIDIEQPYSEYEVMVCKECGSTHLDLAVL